MATPGPLMIDGHLDVAMNALCYDRDQTLEIAAIRQREAKMTADEPGVATVSLPEMRRAGVAVAAVTVIARSRPGSPAEREPLRHDLDFSSRSIAHAFAQGQLAYYRALEARGHVKILDSGPALDAHWRQWERGEAAPVGLVLTMEGADPLVEPDWIHAWHAQGLRGLSLAHFGAGNYAYGTPPRDSQERGPVTELGFELLRQMRGLAIALDLTHLCDQSFFDAIDAFDGIIHASHSNCRALAPSQRQLTDEQARLIIERDGVIGVATYLAMLRPLPREGPQRQQVGMDAMAEHIDHLCQLAGDARHAAIGSDLDGGYGNRHCPRELDTIADLARLGALLQARGYRDDDLASIFHGNWLRHWRRVMNHKPPEA